MPEYLKYAFYILAGVVALMSGILGLLRELYAIHRPERNNQRTAFWNWTIIAFILSSTTLWVIEHNRVSSLSAQLQIAEDRSKPKLHGELGRFSFATADPSDRDTFVTAAVIITNDPSGASTVVKDWDFEVKVDDKWIAVEPIPLPEIIRLQGSDGSEVTLYPAKDYLPWKTMQPIPPGGGVSGFMMGVIRGVNRKKIGSMGNPIKLSFRDVRGTQQTLSTVVGSEAHVYVLRKK